MAPLINMLVLFNLLFDTTMRNAIKSKNNKFENNELRLDLVDKKN